MKAKKGIVCIALVLLLCAGIPAWAEGAEDASPVMRSWQEVFRL